ncbi:MAG: AI-2E family transporter [Clostridia bacterium]|nr:AI-2E family transporter [Clostridia bacterium]NCD02935.1 AI-2E family transporter [Clostridia bacterium]
MNYIKPNFKEFLKYILCVGVIILIITRLDKIFSWAGNLWEIIFPLVLGCLIAYVLNIIMKFLERYWFVNSKNRFVQRTRRGACVFLSIFFVLGAVILIIRIILPELIEAFGVIGKEIPIYFEKVQAWIIANGEMFPSLAEQIGTMEINWQEIFERLVGYATSGVSSMLNSAVLLITNVVGSIFNVVIALIFSIYVLLNKEKLKSQLQTLEKVYMSPSAVTRLNKVIETAHSCFTSFISGQCVEAVILGSLCTVGMLLLRFPYAPMVGTLIGATALIPMVGAYLGAAVGAFMIFTVNPIKALGFLIFIVILQQLEGNLIYPKVVGVSIGLPGIWVLVAVTIGGGLGGVPGMLIGVPLTATIYRLICHDVKERKEKMIIGE